VAKKLNSNRRNFLKLTAAGAAGIALSAPVGKVFAASSRTANGLAPLNKWPGRVVINFDKTLATGNTAPTTAQIATIKSMVDTCIKQLTGQSTVGAAWKSIFPAAISLTSRIAIKVPIGINYANSLTQPHYASVQAIVDGLKLMTFGGTAFPATNITIYDGHGGTQFSDLTGYNSTNFSGVNFVFGQDGNNYTDGAETNDNPAVKQQYATSLHNADYLINVFTPRGHSDYAEYFTLGFKNHYGTYPTTYHDTTNTPQYLRTINCTSQVYQKNVLSVCSGIYGAYEGNGPTCYPDNYSLYSKFMDSTSTNTNPTTIIMSTDPVTAEMQAVKMMRIAGNGTTSGLYATANMPNFLKASGGVQVTGTNWPPNPNAPTVMDKIGIINESEMTLIRIINGVITTGVQHSTSFQNAAETAAITASQIHGHGSTFIEYSLPSSHAGNMAAIEIYDIKGSLVTRLSHRISGYNNHLSWDETNQSGSRVSKGVYIVHLISGAVRVSSRFALAM